MNSNQLLLEFDKIGMTAGRNEKQDLLNKLLKDSQIAKDVVRYAYNPLLTFGIIPTKEHDDLANIELSGYDFEENETFKFLDDLISRKLSGDNAKTELKKQLTVLDGNSAKLLVRILRKDLKGGFAESSINKAVKGLIPEFPYMRCSLQSDVDLSKWEWEKGIISQEKADGVFASLNIPLNEDETPMFVSRQGSKFPSEPFSHIFSEPLQKGFQYHGELLVERDGAVLPRETGNGILNSVLKGGSFAENEKPIYMVWDMIPINEATSKNEYKASYINRFKSLLNMTKTTTNVKLIPTVIVKNLKDAYKHFQKMLEQGKEGTIIKKPTMTWRDGTSKEQVKLKVEADVELEIVSIQMGTIGSKNENKPSSLTCKSSCGKLIVDVAVKNEKMRKDLEKNLDDWIGKIITVRGNQILKPSESNENHSIFLPRMVEDHYRNDKSVADDLERIKQQYNDVIGGAK